jgi:hypothetical protein
MGKPRYQKYPRAIVQSRPDPPSTLTVTIPKAIVRQMPLKAGEILEFMLVTEGYHSSAKIRKVAIAS